MDDLRRSFSMTPEQNAVPIELQDRKFGVKVAIIPDLDLLKSASFVFAVNAQLPPDALRARFPTQATVAPAETHSRPGQSASARHPHCGRSRWRRGRFPFTPAFELFRTRARRRIVEAAGAIGRARHAHRR